MNNSYRQQKKRTDEWCSRYIRIRDCVKNRSFDLGPCYTCGRIIFAKDGHSGHFKSRGSGGHSGIYFDERAIHLQCKTCNAFEQGRPEEYEEHLIKDYGQAVVDELKIKHKIGKYTLKDLWGLEEYFRSEVEKYCETYKINRWWIKKPKERRRE